MVEVEFHVGFPAFLDGEGEFSFAGGFKRERWEEELVVIVGLMGRTVSVAGVFYGQVQVDWHGWDVESFDLDAV